MAHLSAYEFQKCVARYRGDSCQILQILSITLFEKTPILQALQASDSQSDLPDPAKAIDSVRLLAGQQWRRLYPVVWAVVPK